MKRLSLALLLMASLAYAADPVGIQTFFRTAPKVTAPTGQTRMVIIDGSTVKQMAYSSVKGQTYALPPATASTLGGVKVGTGLSVAADGTLNNTGVAGVASFNGRGGAVVPSSGDYNIGQISGAATVASSGSYTDLTNKPTIPAAQVPSDWNSSTSPTQILNKPTIPTALSQLTEDATHRTVTDAEKTTWNSNSSPVQSVFGRTGTIAAQTGDYTAVMVGADPLGSATSVQGNLDLHTGLINNPHSVTKSQVGLGNVDNTSDLGKPVSAATQAALDLKHSIAAYNNFSTAQAAQDAAQDASIALKAPLASPALTGTPTAPTATLGTSTAQLATTQFVANSLAPVTYSPVSPLTVTYGTLLTGAYTDLAASGGTIVDIQEATGTNASQVIINFSGVTSFNQVLLRGYYSGGTGHQVQVEIYNVTSGAWDVLDLWTTITAPKWYGYSVVNSADYINAGATQIRLRHLESGINTHHLYLDVANLRLDSLAGGGITEHNALGGRSIAGAHPASAITNAPAGTIAATDVQAALNELATEKEPADATIIKESELSSATNGTRTNVAANEVAVKAVADGLALKADTSSLGTAAYAASSAFATAAQGAKADTALQPTGITAGTIGDTDTVAFARSGGWLSSAWSSIKTTLKGFFDGFYNPCLVPSGLVSDGTTDNSTAINSTITTASANGSRVCLPAGKFKASNVLIKSGVSLEGVGGLGNNTGRGTWIYVTDTANPATTMQSGTELKGVNFYYPNQVTSGTPTVYPPSTVIAAGHSQFLIEDVNYSNSYFAVDADHSVANGHQYITMNHVRGFPLYRGVVDDFSWDIDRFTDVHWNPNNLVGWGTTITSPNSLLSWVSSNGIGFELQRVDWTKISNCFAYGYSKGVNFVDSVAAPGAGQATIIASGFDSCRKGVDISGTAWGVKILDTDVTAWDWQDATFKSGEAISANFTGDLTVDNLNVWGPTGKAFNIVAAGDVDFTNLHVKEYGTAATAANPFGSVGAVTSFNLSGGFVNGGSGTYSRGMDIGVAATNVTVQGVSFKDIGPVGSRQYPISLANGATKVTISKNNFTNTASILDNMTATSKVITDNQGLTTEKVIGTNLVSDGTNSKTWTEVLTASSGGGGSVTSVTSANSDISIANTSTTPVLTLNSGTGANQIVKLTPESKLPAVDGSLLTGITAGATPAGTVTGAVQARAASGTTLSASDTVVVDTTNNRLGVGIATPTTPLQVNGRATIYQNSTTMADQGLLIAGQGLFATSPSPQYGALFVLGYGGVTNDQLYLLNTDPLSATRPALRFKIGLPMPGIDAITPDGTTAQDMTIGSGRVAIGFISTSVQGDAKAKFHVKATTTTEPASIFQGAASQSANITEWRDSSAAVLAAVSAAGGLTIPTINNPAGVQTTLTTIDTLTNQGATISSTGATSLTITNVVAGRYFDFKVTSSGGGTLSIATLTPTWVSGTPASIAAGKSSWFVCKGTGANTADCMAIKENF